MPRRVIGGYALHALIGRGGMSEVYAATHPTLGDRLALKLLREHLASDARAEEAFLAEAAQTRAVRHPNVVRVVDVGRDAASGCCYLVMERVDGEDLATRLRRCTRLAEPAARALFAAIADGMQAVHASGLVHRDLKPANVMLHGDEPRIVDFGIAKYLGDAGALSTGRRVGTPAYMAPEQLTGGLIAPWVDVWALGVILFEAVTGRLPFDGFTDGRCPQLFETAPRASTLATISPALDRLIASCLDRDPGKRPRSMDTIARALRGEATDEDERFTEDAGPLLAPPPLATSPTVALRPAPARARAAASAPEAVPPVAPAASGKRGGIVLALVSAAMAVAVGVTIAMIVTAGRTDGADAATAPATAEVASAASVPPPVPAQPDPAPVPAPPDPTAAPPPVPAPVPVATTLAIEVRSKPAGAQILIDGKPRGTTPVRLELAGPTSIVVRRAGYRTMRVRADRAGAFDVRLVPLRRGPHTPHHGETLD